MNMSDIANMSRIQRLQAMEALWDSLIHETKEPESPEWHQEVLVARRHKLEQGNAEFLSLDALKARKNYYPSPRSR